MVKLILASLGMPKNEFGPSRSNIECYLFNPLPSTPILACTENIPNMDNIVCKTTNCEPKLYCITSYCHMHDWEALTRYDKIE